MSFPDSDQYYSNIVYKTDPQYWFYQKHTCTVETKLDNFPNIFGGSDLYLCSIFGKLPNTNISLKLIYFEKLPNI